MFKKASWEKVSGTHLQGYIYEDYDRLVEAFGEPSEGDGYKVDAEWIIEFDDGTVATIYNWKNGRNYCGGDGLDVEAITDWHIGGRSKRAVELVQAVLDNVIVGECVDVTDQKLLG